MEKFKGLDQFNIVSLLSDENLIIPETDHQWVNQKIFPTSKISVKK